MTAPADTRNPPVHSFPAPASAIAAAWDAPAQPAPPKVFIALCTRDWQSEAHTTESVRHIGQRYPGEIMVKYMMNDGVARARNNLAADFLESDAEILFFLDNDIIIEPKHFERIVMAAVTRGIVGGLYPKKQPVLDWVVNWLQGEEPDADGFAKVKHMGTGALAISRSVLKTFIEKTPHIAYGGDPSPESLRWDLFPMHAIGPNHPVEQVERIKAILESNPDGLRKALSDALQPISAPGRYDSEDWAFCNNARKLGLDVWCDTKTQLRHIGKIVYPLQFTLTDEELVDIFVHRYDIYPDAVRAFMASGRKTPGLMGGHRERGVRLWPRDYPVSDLHQGDVLNGSYDVPIHPGEGQGVVVIDIGADVGAYARWISQKRWKKAQLHCYEGRSNLVNSLQITANMIADKGSPKPVVYAGWPSAQEAAEAEHFGNAVVVKIDAKGEERTVIEAMHASGRLAKLDALVVRYYDAVTVQWLGMVLATTHVQHVNQPYADGSGVVKWVRRVE